MTPCPLRILHRKVRTSTFTWPLISPLFRAFVGLTPFISSSNCEWVLYLILYWFWGERTSSITVRASDLISGPCGWLLDSQLPVFGLNYPSILKTEWVSGESTYQAWHGIAPVGYQPTEEPVHLSPHQYSLHPFTAVSVRSIGFSRVDLLILSWTPEHMITRSFLCQPRISDILWQFDTRDWYGTCSRYWYWGSEEFFIPRSPLSWSRWQLGKPTDDYHKLPSHDDGFGAISASKGVGCHIIKLLDSRYVCQSGEHLLEWS